MMMMMMMMMMMIIFSDQEEMTEMVTWALNTTTDPLTNTLHEGVQYSATFWLPIRFEQVSTLLHL